MAIRAARSAACAGMGGRQRGQKECQNRVSGAYKENRVGEADGYLDLETMGPYVGETYGRARFLHMAKGAANHRELCQSGSTFRYRHM